MLLKAGTGLRIGILALGTLALVRCDRQALPPAVRPSAPKVPATPLDPWTWHYVGGLLVIQGELDQTTELRLKGRTLSETWLAPAGPVRWELYRPPAGEVAELRSGDGTLLAAWDFDAQPPPPPRPPVAQARPPKPVPPPPPPIVKNPYVSRIPGGDTEKVEPPKPVPPPPVAKVEPPKPVPPPAVAKVEPPKPVPSPPIVKVEPPKPVPPPPIVKVEPPRPLPPPPPAPVEPPRLPAAAGSPLEWPGAGEGLNLLRGPKGARSICMTFDGGSTAEVAVDILDVLHEHGIRTTLFLTGEFIHKYPDIVRRMAAEGHELGNHTLTHPHLAPRMKRDPLWTRERFQKELLDADRALVQLLGRPMDPYWRAPYGEQTGELRRWAEELGYRHVGWSEGADTLDWATVKERRIYHTGNAILDRLEKRMGKADGDGLIVLMHLGSMRPAVDRPAKYLGPFVDRALQQGWHFVAVGDYLKAMGKQRWESSRRAARINQGN